jgi:hypothetical protein
MIIQAFHSYKKRAAGAPAGPTVSLSNQDFRKGPAGYWGYGLRGDGEIYGSGSYTTPAEGYDRWNFYIGTWLTSGSADDCEVSYSIGDDTGVTWEGCTKGSWTRLSGGSGTHPRFFCSGTTPRTFEVWVRNYNTQVQLAYCTVYFRY